LIDGVFLAPPNRGALQVDSSGNSLEVPESNDANGSSETTGHIWGTNRVQLPTDEVFEANARTPFEAVGHAELDGRLLVMHAAKGLSLDLQAISHAHSGMRPLRFSASVLNMSGLIGEEPGRRESSQIDVLVLVDGQIRARRAGLTFEDGPAAIDVELRPGDRFLTLAVLDGGDGRSFDWLVWGRPVLEMNP